MDRVWLDQGHMNIEKYFYTAIAMWTADYTYTKLINVKSIMLYISVWHN